MASTMLVSQCSYMHSYMVIGYHTAIHTVPLATVKLNCNDSERTKLRTLKLENR